MRTRLLARTALVAFAVAMLGACATIPERAWSNGRAMSTSDAYYRILSGDRSLATQRELMSSSDPRRLHSEVRWTPSRGDQK
jgi:hypothetical protein